jgi:hypothetical protein
MRSVRAMNRINESVISLTLTLLALFALLACVLNVLGYAFAFSRTDAYVAVQSNGDGAPASGLL